jgi:HTH-type transcriptional regulator/antitoxin HipB
MHQTVRLPNQLGAIIQSERLKQGMTQSELASLTGSQQKTISAIESGSAGTKLDTLLSVIASLGLDMQIVPREQGRKSIEDVF